MWFPHCWKLPGPALLQGWVPSPPGQGTQTPFREGLSSRKIPPICSHMRAETSQLECFPGGMLWNVWFLGGRSQELEETHGVWKAGRNTAGNSWGWVSHILTNEFGKQPQENRKGSLISISPLGQSSRSRSVNMGKSCGEGEEEIFIQRTASLLGLWT